MSRERMRADQRRAQLVSVAADLFSARGVEGTAVSDIVAAAGVSQGAFYWHFASKTDVVNAVTERLCDDVLGDAVRLAESPSTNAVDLLLGVRDVLVSVMRSDRALLAFLHSPGNEALHDRISREAARRMVPAFECVIEQGEREGVFALRHGDDGARFLAALLDITDPYDAFASPDRIEHHVEALTEFALRGLGCAEEVIERALAIEGGARS